MLNEKITAQFDPRCCQLLIKGQNEQDVYGADVVEAIRFAAVNTSHVKTVTLEGVARVMIDDQFPQLINVERMRGNVVLEARVDLGKIMPALQVIDGNLTLYVGAGADTIDEVTGTLELHRDSRASAVRHVGNLDAGEDAYIPELRSVRQSASMRGCSAPELMIVGEYANVVNPLQVPKLNAVGRGADWFFFQGKRLHNESGYDGRSSGTDLAGSMVNQLREQDRLLAIGSKTIAEKGATNRECYRASEELGL